METPGRTHHDVNKPAKNAADHAPLFSSFASDADMAELVALFVNELSNRTAELQRMLANNDLDGVRRLAHQLKGASAGYGFPSVGLSAGELEVQATRALQSRAQHDLTRLNDQATELLALCGRVRAA